MQQFTKIMNLPQNNIYYIRDLFWSTSLRNFKENAEIYSTGLHWRIVFKKRQKTFSGQT